MTNYLSVNNNSPESLQIKKYLDRHINEQDGNPQFLTLWLLDWLLG